MLGSVSISRQPLLAAAFVLLLGLATLIGVSSSHVPQAQAANQIEIFRGVVRNIDPGELIEMRFKQGANDQNVTKVEVAVSSCDADEFTVGIPKDQGQGAAHAYWSGTWAPTKCIVQNARVTVVFGGPTTPSHIELTVKNGSEVEGTGTAYECEASGGDGGGEGQAASHCFGLSVGGVAELPDAAIGVPPAFGDSPGSRARRSAAVAAGVGGAALVALGGAAWFVRRRRVM